MSISFTRNLILLCIITFSSAFGQNETNHWYFGERAGLYFELQQNPQILFDGAMIAKDVCATISDRDGNLQFYTNGVNIWNSNHVVMVNGALVGTLGIGIDPNNVEPDVLLNVIIVPIVEQNGLYYVFTVSSSSGLRYSIVDMNLNNGLGEVIDKNKPIAPGKGFGKLSAVHHADGKSIWVMTTKKNDNDEFTSFYVYKVNTNGVIEAPVITDTLFYNGLQEGVIKFSPDGSKIACANYRPQALSNHLSIFDFNSASGIVSKKRNLLTSFVFFEVVSAYGVEFSNDSKYLYASLIRQGMFAENSTNFQPDAIRRNLLYQYDLANPNPQESATSLHDNASGLSASSLQLSKNGKIYRALALSGNQGTPFLGVINSPEVFGTGAGYVHNAVSLDPNKSRLGLPSFIQSYFRTRILSENVCMGEPMPFEVDTYADITAANWDFGDGTISNEIEPSHSYSASGNYNVTAIITINNREITVTEKVRVFELPNLIENQELEQCDDDTDGISTFNLNTIREKITNPILNEDLYFYTNRNDAEQDVNRITKPESYVNINPNQEVFVRAVNQNGCHNVSSFFISARFVDLGNISEMYACGSLNNDSNMVMGRFPLAFKKDDIRAEVNLASTTNLRYFPTLFDAQTTQNEITERFYLTTTATIWVRAEEQDLSCSGIASIMLFVSDVPIIDINDDYLICKDEPIELEGDSSNDRFEWLNDNADIISTNRLQSFSEAGTFTHVAYRTENGLECSNSKDFTIRRTDAPTFDTINIVENTKNNHTLSVIVGGTSDYEFSMNNIDFFGDSNTFSFNTIPSGIHTIYVRDIKQCEPTIQKKIYIIGYPSFFTPNNDGVNDFWRIKGLEEDLYESIRIRVFDRFGKLITILNQQNNFSWGGNYNGNLAPPNDYWFEVVFKTGEIKRGHFTLKR